MDKKMFKIGYLVGVVLIIGLGIMGYMNAKSILSSSTLSTIELDQIEVEDFNNKKIKLTVDKPIVVNFWATWCAPCVEELPYFEELQHKYKDQVDFLMVSEEEVSKIEKFKNKKGYTLNLVRSSKKNIDYGLNAIPATFFYNSEGKLINKIVGSLTKEDLEIQITNLLK